MHDEDNAIGFNVSNPAGKSWSCHGDKRALDHLDGDNLKHCVEAVQASADEIYTAYSTKKAPSESSYAAWELAPTLESALSTSQQLAPLFTFKLERRKDIKNRTLWEFTTNYWFWSTAAACKESGLWVHPITVAPWSNISVVTPRPRSLRLFYQMPGGAIVQSMHVDGKWTALHDQPVTRAVNFSPLTFVAWNNEKEVRRPHISGTPPNRHLGRSARTTLTVITSSKSIAILKEGAGFQGRLVK